MKKMFIFMLMLSGCSSLSLDVQSLRENVQCSISCREKELVVKSFGKECVCSVVVDKNQELLEKISTLIDSKVKPQVKESCELTPVPVKEEIKTEVDPLQDIINN